MAAVATSTREREAPRAPYDLPSPPLQATCVAQRDDRPGPRSRKRPLAAFPSSSPKLEKCRTQAQQRRMTQKGLMDELAGLLPFPREVTSQMDTKTVLRLAVCYLRVKSLMAEESSSPSSSSSSSYEQPSLLPSAGGWPHESPYQPHSMATWNPAAGRNGMGPGTSDPLAALEAGILQDLMVEALHGFLMVASCDGIILYLSETVFTHTGLFQSEHTGKSMYALIHEEDHREVREALSSAEAAALSSGAVPCSFFCRLKSKKKNSHLKAPGYKLVYVSGHCKVHQLEPYIACMVHIVSAPSVLEIRVEGNTFTTRHSLEMKIIFFDERMHDVLGYSKKDLLGQSLFSLHHHDDLAVTEKCSHKVREKGEAVTGYYRLLTNYGTYVWLQTRGTMVMDRRTGKPSQLLCMHFLVDKEKGDHSLKLRSLLAEEQAMPTAVTMDPVPVPRPDGKSVNPLSLTHHTPSPSTKLTGITPHHCEGVTPPSLSPPSSSPPDSAPPVAMAINQQLVPQATPPTVSETLGASVMATVPPLTNQIFTSSATPPNIKVPDQFPCSKSTGLQYPFSQTAVLPCSQSVVQSGQQLCPPLSLSSSPSLSSSSPSLSSSAVPTPFSTPVLSPYWPEETSPFFGPYSNPNSNGSMATNPRSFPNSTVASPRPIPGQPAAVAMAMNPDPSSLEAILQELLGGVEDGGPAPLPNTVSISISPDSDCTELDSCLAGFVSSSGCSPQPSSTTDTPTPSPAGYFSSNPSSSAPSPLEAPPISSSLFTCSTFSPPPPAHCQYSVQPETSLRGLLTHTSHNIQGTLTS